VRRAREFIAAPLRLDGIGLACLMRFIFQRLHQVFCAIVYVLRTGCQWKALPREFGSASAVHAVIDSAYPHGFTDPPVRRHRAVDSCPRRRMGYDAVAEMTGNPHIRHDDYEID